MTAAGRSSRVGCASGAFAAPATPPGSHALTWTSRTSARDLERLRDACPRRVRGRPDLAALEALERATPRQEGRADAHPARHRRAAGRGPAAGRGHRERDPGGDRSRPRRATERPSARPRSTARLAAETVDVTTPGRPSGAATSTRSWRRSREIAADLRPSSGSWSTRRPRSRTTSPTSRCSTSRPITRPATCGTRSTSTSTGHLLRTHTSPGQIRVMQPRSRPSAPCCPGAASATRRSTPATPRSSSRSRG